MKYFLVLFSFLTGFGGARIPLYYTHSCAAFYWLQPTMTSICLFIWAKGCLLFRHYPPHVAHVSSCAFCITNEHRKALLGCRVTLQERLWTSRGDGRRLQTLAPSPFREQKRLADSMPDNARQLWRQSRSEDRV